MNAWTLTCNGTTKTFSAWGIYTDGFSITRQSASADTVSFVQHKDFDSAPDFPYDAEILILKNGANWFRGNILTPSRSGTVGPKSPRAFTYTASNVWNALERVAFEQFWRKADGEMSASVVILGKTINGNRLTCGEQIKEILDFAKAQGVAIQYVATDLIGLDIIAPETQETDITCSEAIAAMLRWHKDATTWVDYSTTIPTLRFAKRSSAAAITVDLSGSGNARNLSISERPDLKARGVVIRYSSTSTVDGIDYHNLVEDTAGLTTGKDVIKMTISLEGSSRSTETSKITTEGAPVTNAAIEARLIQLNPWIESDRIVSRVWSGHTVDSGGLTQILKSGTILDWMGERTHSGLVQASVKNTYIDGTVETVVVSDQPTFTSASERTYSRTSSYSPGEATPTGLAAKIYNQLSAIQYQGTVTLIEADLGNAITPGSALNITGGAAEWATMRAQIQQVTQTPETGSELAQTRIAFGPAEHLSAQDFIEMMRANRIRKTVTSSSMRSSGEADNLQIGGEGPSSNGTAGASGFSRLVVTSEDPARTVDIDPAASTWEAGKALVITDDGLSTEWGDAMPPVGSGSVEYMVLTLKMLPIPGQPELLRLTPVWDWLRLVNTTMVG